MELLILAVPLVLLYVMVSRGRKQQRELAATQNAITPGTRIMTTSGMFADVVEVESEAVLLEIAPGVVTRWSKRAIGQVIAPVAEEEDEPVFGSPGAPGAQGAEGAAGTTEAAEGGTATDGR